jgi:hypothetical protein
MNRVPPPKRLVKKIKKFVSPRQAKHDLAVAWQRILGARSAEWEQIKNCSRTGPRILIASGPSGHGAVAPIESALAVALTLRGANVHFLVCDGFLPACWPVENTKFSDVREFVHSGQARFCRKCFTKGKNVRQSLGLPMHLYSELVARNEMERANALSTTVNIDSIPDYRLDEIAIGEHSLAGALRFYGRGNLDGESHAEPITRKFFKAALLTSFAVRGLFRNYPFDCVVSYHGIYIPEGVIGEVARPTRGRVVNWQTAYRKRCFIFSHNDTYHHTMIAEPVDKWEQLVWNSQLDSQLMDYLKTRWRGTEDWISFLHDNPQFDPQEMRKEIGIDLSKPCIGMLTNVMWDAQLHYPANAFPNMLEWVLRTIDYFARRPDLQLLIRVHPAEITGFVPSRQPLVAEISKAFPIMPKNVFIIPPESALSTYAAMLLCDSVIIYATKTGVELSSMGIPVVVAGEAWILNKGITLDASTMAEYFRILDRLPLKRKLDDLTMTRARKYAYHFFFRRMVPLEFMEPTDAWPPIRMVLQNLDELRPGRYQGLDVICDGILKGTDFIYPAENGPH